MFPLLIHLRYLAVTSQMLVVLFVGLRLGLGIPIAPMLGVSAVLLVFNLAVHARWWLTRDEGSHALMQQLLVDMLALTALLYFAGGPANPFVSLYLVPVAIAAVGLEIVPMVVLTLLSVVLYTALMRWHMPLPTIHGRDFELHVIGMWINFLFAVAIMAGVLGRFMVVVKAQRQALSQTRERALRDESILALGSLAAGTAHELNTPLTTMGLLIDDWSGSGDVPDEDDFKLMRAQLAHCRQHVRTLADIARRSVADEPMPQPASAFVSACVERWRLLRPSVVVELEFGDNSGERHLWVDAMLPQALINLFNNAADANAACDSDAGVQIAVVVSDLWLQVRISDRGPGFANDSDLHERSGNDSPGLGLGLMISNASIERAHGEVRRYARDGGGSVTEVGLPLIVVGA